MNYTIDDNDLPELSPQKPLGRPKGSFRVVKNKAEQKMFIQESVRKILVEHFSHRDYVNWCKSQNISVSQANQYWKSSWISLRKKFELEKDKLVLKHLAHYWDIHSRAIDEKDFTNARQSLNDIAKLIGLNEPEKVKVEHQVIKLNFGEPETNE
jgi:nitric oxide reductase activation protein